MIEKRSNNSELTPELLEELSRQVHGLYLGFTSGLPFHGWHHVEFVRARAVTYAHKNGADAAIVEAAALLHDLNYMVKRNSRASAAEDLRRQILHGLQVSSSNILMIETVIREAETEARDANAGLEAQALSDADTIFKALPITPVLLSHLYMEETGETLRQLCTRIIRDQVKLYNEGIYFYNPEVAEQYERWAAANLNLWLCIEESLGEEEVRDLVLLLETAEVK
jgi:uncharacterized protein